jgi:hypothetical protein
MTAWGQSLPLDFDDPDDANWSGFNGTTTSVTADPDDANNSVLQMVGGTADFDGAAISLDTYVDLSDDANNTITFDMYTPLDGSSSNNHLLKLEGGPSGATELAFTTSGTGWQQVSVDFPAGLGNQYPVMVIFTDAGVGNTATGTYYIDNIDGPNGDPVPTTPEPDGPAPDPSTPDEEALSIYGDFGYSNVWVRDYNFGTSSEVNLDANGTNNALLVNFQNAGYGEGTNAVTDISDYDTLHFDYWADANSSELIFFLIEDDGGVTEYTYTINAAGTNATIVNEVWTRVSIPLSYFEDLGFSKDRFFQWKVDRSNGDVSDFVYFDNIHFSKEATSVNNVVNKGVLVYPNPVQIGQDIMIGTDVQSELKLFNTQGMLIRNLRANQLTTQGLVPGMYFLKVRDQEGKISSQTVIIE